MVWGELTRPWHDTAVDHCDVCGNLLIGACWSFEDARTDKTLRCCSPRCEQLYGRLLDARRTSVAWSSQQEA